MSAARKIHIASTLAAQAARTAAASTLALADETAQPGVNGVLEQHRLLSSAFASAPATGDYPGAVKLAILVGAPVALWTGLFAAGAWLTHRL